MNLDQLIRSFWQKRSILNYLLVPFSWIYLGCHYLKFYVFNRPKKVDAFVICVGNITAGGGGKTPFCIALGQELQQKGLKVAFITKGYGRQKSSEDTVIKVESGMDYRIIGDEPLLLAAIAPTYVANSRFSAARKAVSNGADIIILDDGLQDNSIHKDFTYLIVNAKYKFGNELCLPAGPMREPLYWAFNKVDEVCCGLPLNFNEKPCIKISEEYSVSGVVINKRVIAFCGIANPDQFYNELNKMGFELVKTYTFPDHHSYNESELQNIMNKARECDVQVITTSKDFVKLPKRMHDKVLILRKVVVVDLEESKLCNFIAT